MYQTVGSNDIVPLVSECLGLPLFRKCITGKSVSVDMEYTIESTDEVEDLLHLLQDVKESFPDIQGVSVGAILSNYQRIRVEHVCSRLSLTPLSFLWQSNQSELLQSMLDNNLTAVLAKVAAMGLDTRHLGKTLGEMQPLLEKLSRDYGCHVAGEGGEYETLTLDCPLFKKRIVLVDQETIIHSNDAFAIVAYLKFTNARLEDKHPSEIGLTDEIKTRLLEFGQHNNITNQSVSHLVKKYIQDSSTHPQITITTQEPVSNSLLPSSSSTQNGFLSIKNILSKKNGTVEQETRDCMEQLTGLLKFHGFEWKHVIMMHLFVADMNEFGLLNSVYGSFLGTNPPTRITVEVSGLVGKRRIQMDCLAFNQDATQAFKVNKSVMHVQGVSYWAPSNIGPYSQTVKLNDHLYVAGQIGLIPHTMTLPSLSSDPTNFSQLLAECIICFNNISSIASVQNCEFPQDLGVMVCFVRRHEYLHIVKRFCEDRIKNFKNIPSLFLAVPKLPRSCAVEFQVMFQNPNDLPIVDDDTDDEEVVVGMPRSLPVVAEVFKVDQTITFENEETKIQLQVSTWTRGSLLCMTGDASVSEGSNITNHHIQKAISTLLDLNQKALQENHHQAGGPLFVKLFHRKEIDASIVQQQVERWYASFSKESPSISFVPVNALGQGMSGLIGVHILESMDLLMKLLFKELLRGGMGIARVGEEATDNDAKSERSGDGCALDAADKEIDRSGLGVVDLFGDNVRILERRGYLSIENKEGG
ncbi:UNVERIFIED_CONTAM: ATP binding domain 4 [Siphonaria sp. JEL0065]|nr:ATP binding domain 4 [Siphonaria sp. JEL0065]